MVFVENLSFFVALSGGEVWCAPCALLLPGYEEFDVHFIFEELCHIRLLGGLRSLLTYGLCHGLAIGINAC